MPDPWRRRVAPVEGPTWVAAVLTALALSAVLQPADGQSSFERTIVFVYAPTVIGQNVFLRGGLSGSARPDCSAPAQSDPCAVPIRHRVVPQDTGSAYRHWSAGDRFLDWYGSEAGQGNFSGTLAGGTPLIWTSYSSPTGPTVERDGRGYTPLNRFGDHYWMLDVDMDCSQTHQGWFEFKTYTTPTLGWERDVTQYAYCAGLPTLRRPYVTNNHLARCGLMNVFYSASADCNVYPIPVSTAAPASGCGARRMFPDATPQSSSNLLSALGVPPLAPSRQSSPELRIVNGQAASLGRWPWQGIHQYDNSLGGCACVLIDRLWALTAAHCVRGTNPLILRVHLGQQNLISTQGNEQVLRVSSIHIHPNYGISDGTGVYEGDYDIALLRLATAADLSGYVVNAACLPRGYETDAFVNDECWATGFGSTLGTADSNRLNEIQVPVYSFPDCVNAWGINRISIRQVCMGTPSKSACGGDSGGPLVCWRDGRWVLVGITSWGSSTCQDKPSVYTRITEFIGWIDSITSTER